MKMEVIYPQLEELYMVITNDFYNLSLEKRGENTTEKLESEKNILKIKDKIKQLKIFISKNKTKNINDSDIIQFLSKYINIIDTFFTKEKIEKIEVQYADQYCLSYLALVFFKFFCDDNEDMKELFQFNIDKYENFSKFINHYSLFKQIKGIYEENSISVLNECKIDKNLFIYLIIKFDNDSIFYPKSNEEGHKKIENEKENANKINIEQFKENDLITTKTNSGKKENRLNNGISEEKQIHNDINARNKICEINEDLDSSIKKDVKDNLTANIITTNINNYENESKENIISKDIKNIIDEKVNEKLNEIKSEMKVTSIKTDFDIIELKIKLIKTQECLEYGNIINLEYINNEKKKVEYLENYHKSLKNMIIKLSNPYNFNFWRKKTNIILKNIFIILRNNKFTITQEKDDKVLSQLEKNFYNLKSELKAKYQNSNKHIKINKLPTSENISKKIDKYKTELNPKKKTKINIADISQAADKEINKDKSDITALLSIDFLFFLKEKGNQIDHFEEKLLNFLLFNEINIIENDEIKIDEKKSELLKKEDIKEDKKKAININEKNNVKVNKIVKIEKKIKRYPTQIKEIKKNVEEGNIPHKTIIRSLNKPVKNNYDKKEEKDEIKIGNISLNNKYKKVIKNIKIIKQSKEINEKEEKNNQTKTEKNNKNENNPNLIKGKLNKKYEGKIKFNGKELIEMLESPIKFQQKILKITDNLFDLRNNKINEFKKDIKYDEMLKAISKFEKNKEFEILLLRISQTIKNIENYIENRYGNKVNIQSLNITEINDMNLKEMYNKYSQLVIYEKEISNKIKSLESEKKLVTDLQENIKKYESDINRMINQIKDKLKKESELIILLDIFDEYKEDLKTKIDKKNKHYLHYKHIFTKQNIDTFTFNDLISFLKKQFII